jgi:hypothetical protein
MASTKTRVQRSSIAKIAENGLREVCRKWNRGAEFEAAVQDESCMAWTVQSQSALSIGIGW